MSEQFITADPHLGHANAIINSSRPFSNVHEMNEKYIIEHNKVVKDEDEVYINGDFCFHNSAGGKDGEGQTIKFDQWRKRLKGNLIFLRGNHDKNNGGKSKIHRIVIRYANMHIEITHKPTDVIIEDDLHYYPLHFTGHVHEKWLTQERTNLNGKIALCVNCGVDQWNYRPVNIQKLMSVYFKWLKNHKRKRDINYWIRQSNNRKNQ